MTFVNPQPHKGVFAFARLAEELGRRRPDIPLLVVEGPGQADWVRYAGSAVAGLRNVSVMANTPDPRDFYRVSKVVLMPSLWNEAFSRVAAESLINGIPVLGSDRGGLPEGLAEMGFVLPMPSQYTLATCAVPSADEVEPWVETVLRLWDDAAWYEAQWQRCLAAEAWRPARLLTQLGQWLQRVVGAALPVTSTSPALP